MSDELVYLLWSNKHQMWWKSGANGYTYDMGSAGRFTEAEAAGYVVQSSHCGILSQVTCMVVAPEISEGWMNSQDGGGAKAEGAETFGSGAGHALMILALLGGMALLVWACGGLR